MVAVHTVGDPHHNLIKSEKYANVAIGVLQRELSLANLLWRWSAMDFKGALDDTVNVKVPGTLKAHDRALRATGDDRRMQLDFLTERKVGIKLTKFPYSATEITDEVMDLDIVNFTQQILQPQVQAMAETIEGYAVDLLTKATYADGRLSADRTKIEDATTIKGTLEASDFYGAGKHGMASLFNRVRSNMRKRGVGATGLKVAVGADFEEMLLEENTLMQSGYSGGDDSALREATIGRLRGFDFVTVPSLPANEAYVFHPTAFVLATAAPSIPAGATFGASQNANGTALRWLRDYDADFVVDRSIVDCYAGTGEVKDVSMEDGEEHLLRAMKITMDRDKVEAAKAAAGTSGSTTSGSTTSGTGA